MKIGMKDGLIQIRAETLEDNDALFEFTKQRSENGKKDATPTKRRKRGYRPWMLKKKQEAMKRSWETRRKLYGKSGFSRGYAPGRKGYQDAMPVVTKEENAYVA